MNRPLSPASSYHELFTIECHWIFNGRISRLHTIIIPRRYEKWNHDGVIIYVNMRKFKPLRIHLFLFNEKTSQTTRKFIWTVWFYACVFNSSSNIGWQERFPPRFPQYSFWDIIFTWRWHTGLRLDQSAANVLGASGPSGVSRGIFIRQRKGWAVHVDLVRDVCLSECDVTCAKSEYDITALNRLFI